jgi:hypothetical protein
MFVPPRFHWNVNDVGLPLHVPVEHDSTEPTCGVPDSTGAAVLTGGAGAAVGTTVLESALVEPVAFVAVTVHLTFWPSSATCRT